MRVRNWNMLAFVTVAAVGLTACGGDAGAGGDAASGADTAADTAAAAGQQGQQGQQQVALAEGVTQDQFDQGRQLFTGQGGCHACHNPEATGTQLAPDLTDDTWINVTDPNIETISQLIRTGVAQPQEHPAPMPPMGGANLSEPQIQALAGYVLSIAGG